MWNALKRIITLNPMGIFVYAILSKWYLSIAVAGLVVTFWVFKGLKAAGVIDEAEIIVERALHDSKAVAKFCVPKITDISAFWHCLNNLPDYTPEQDEIDLIDKVNKIRREFKSNPNHDTKNDPDPYYDDGK